MKHSVNQLQTLKTNRFAVVCILSILVLSLGAARTPASNSYWNNPAGGSFNDSANWSSGMPGPFDTAYFPSNASYQVSWVANATNQYAYVTNGLVTNAIGSATWRITGEYVVGRGAGVTGSVSHVSGTLVVTNNLGTGKITSGRSANRNYTLDGGTAVADYLDFVDDGAAAYSKFLDYGTLTTLHGSLLTVGDDLVFTFQGGRRGTWNMLGGTNIIVGTSVALLYTQLGWAWDSQYIFNVSGPTTVWSNVLYLVVGNVGSGHQVNISGGAKVFNGDTFIGRYGSSDVITVDGTNSLWNIQSYSSGSLQGDGILFISEDANACQLIISNGGQVKCGEVIITRYTSGKDNSVLVTGGNSLWNISSNLVVGDYGTSNRVTIANGGRINCVTAYLGGSISSTATGAATNNSMLVTDANSILNATNGVRVGSFAGKCSFVVTNAGRVQSGGSTVVGVNSACSNNVVVIAGAGTVWTNASVFTMGSFGGNNLMTVSGGAQLFNTRGTVGNAAASNLVVVTDAGSLWNNATELWIGNTVNSVGNQLLVMNNGTVLTTNLLVSVSSSAANNMVTVAGGNLLATNSGQYGTIDVRRGMLNLLAGLVEADRLFLTNGPLSRLNFSGGRLNSRNTVVNNAQIFTVGSGTNWARFNLIGGTHAFANGLAVSSSAWLTGSGTISGNVTNAGVMAPGDAIGSLTINGNLQLLPGSDFAFDLGGHSAGVDYDYVFVSGSIIWNGNLRISLVPGFTPGLSDVFTIAQGSGDSGGFANVASGSRLKTTDNLGSFLVTYGGGNLQLSNYQSTDLDGDGIEDAWAIQYFGSSPLLNGTGPNNKFGDKDGDGPSNYAEFIAGTNPTNAASTFKLTVAASDPSSVTLQFPFVFGRTYRLWFSTNLTSWLELPVPGYVGPQSDVGQWKDDGSLAGGVPFNSTSPHFYRISVQ
jgi:T5SS/PEP-CTERM-associated repeat protein